MIYFDNSATTKPYPEALETYMQVASKILGNPSSLHRLGDQATRILDASRQQIADLIGKKSVEIFFTSGGTEGDNWVIKGVAFEKSQFGKHIIVSAIEHPAVKESALWLKSQGFEVDFATFSSHKFHGVRGVGFVYIKSGKKITPLLTGGGQERDYRSTTENVAGIAATAKALRLSMEKLNIFTSKTGQMKAVIRQALLDYPDIFVFSDEEDFAPHILTFGIKGVRGEVIVHAFEDYDIFISTTSACSSKAGKPAGTLIAMGVDKDKAQSAVRLSLDLENDMSQVEQFLTKLKLIYNQTRKVR